MYQEHSDFRLPANAAATVWRYSTLSKFLAVVTSGQLFFCRADRFKDPHEGLYPKSASVPIAEALGISATEVKLSRPDLGYTGVSCWNLQEHEKASL